MKKNKLLSFIIGFLILSICVLLILEAQASTTEVNYQISVIVNDSTSSRWTRFRAGLEQAAKDYNVNLNYVTTTSLNGFSDEKEIIDTEISNGTNAVIVQLVHGSSASDYINTQSQKLPIALVDTDIDSSSSSNAYTVVQPDNTNMGSALAEMVIDGISSQEKARVGIVTGNSASMFLRSKSVQNVLQSRNIEIAWSVQTVDEAIMKQKTSKVAAIATLDNDTLEGIADEYRGKDAPLIYGIGCSDKTIFDLDHGTITGMIVPNEYTMGYVSLSNLAIHLNNRLTNMDNTYVNYFTVTKENLYSTENQKMIFPIVG